MNSDLNEFLKQLTEDPMSVLALSELNDNVVSFGARRIAKRLEIADIVERQVSVGCESRKVYGLQAEACHDEAARALQEGRSHAMAVAAAMAKADQIVRDRNCVRSRGRDDDGPKAA